MKRPRDLQGHQRGPWRSRHHQPPSGAYTEVKSIPHPYCKRLRVKVQGALRIFSDLGSLEVQTLSGTIMCQPFGQKESIDIRNVGFSLKKRSALGTFGDGHHPKVESEFCGYL